MKKLKIERKENIQGGQKAVKALMCGLGVGGFGIAAASLLAQE